MYLMDYHTHSMCSPDSNARLEDMAYAARRAGMREMCTTDHCDLQQQDGSPLQSWDWEPILNQYERIRTRFGKGSFRVRLGLELGGAQTDPDRAEEILAGAPLDFVIGSIHNQSPAAGGRDLFYIDYSSREYCEKLLDDYLDSLLKLAPLPCYDALGHIIYPLRYIGRAGYEFPHNPWGERLDPVLKTVIETGRAIEINTHAGREVEDWFPIVKRYKELGGEFITLGSDAHRPGNVALGLEQAALMLQAAGFRYLTRYRRRKPDPIKIATK